MTSPSAHRPIIARFLSVASILALSACAVRQAPLPNRPGDHVFIEYWGAEKAGGKLRLAVKDLIDVRGTVTSSGTEYHKQRGIRAKQDAACLAIARERGVAIPPGVMRRPATHLRGTVWTELRSLQG